MCVMLDAMAVRYHVLPSQVLVLGDTLDYYVMDVAMAVQRFNQERTEDAAAGRPPPPPTNLTVNKMQDMIKKVRG